MGSEPPIKFYIGNDMSIGRITNSFAYNLDNIYPNIYTEYKQPLKNQYALKKLANSSRFSLK